MALGIWARGRKLTLSSLYHRQSQATVVNLGKGKSYSVDRSLCDSGAAIQKGLCEEEIHPVCVEQLY